MKRDMDLIRVILLKIEENNEPIDSDDLIDLGWEERLITYHIRLLVEADLLNAIAARTKHSEEYLSISLTWEGHEFLDAARDQTRWEQAKEVAS